MESLIFLYIPARFVVLPAISSFAEIPLPTNEEHSLDWNEFGVPLLMFKDKGHDSLNMLDNIGTWADMY